MNKEETIVNGYYQTNIKTSRNEDSVYAMKYASQQMLIDKLQQENQSLKDRIEKAIEWINDHTIEWVDGQYKEHNIMVKFDEYLNPQALLEILKRDK